MFQNVADQSVVKKTRRARVEGLEARILLSSYSWTGTAGDGKFSTNGNWSGGTAPSANETGAIIDFPAAASPATLNDDVANLSIQTLTFENNFTLTGNSLTLTGTASVSQISTDVLSNSVVLGGSSVVAAMSAGSTLSFTGVVSGGADLTTNGPGTLSLSGVNTYTGHTTIAGGMLLAKSDTALGDVSAGTVVNSGASLLLAAGVFIAEPITAAGAGFGPGPGAIRPLADTSGTPAGLTGTITLTADATLAGDPGGGSILPSQLNVDGPVVGTGNVTIDGGGIVGFFAAVPNTFSGNLAINGNSFAYLSATANVRSVPHNLNINSGSVALFEDGQFASTSVVNIGASGYINLNAHDSIASLTGSGPIFGAGAITVSGGTPDTYSGAVGGTVGLTASNGTALTLNASGPSNTTGTLTENGGTIALQSSFPNATLAGSSVGPIEGNGTVATLNIPSGQLQPGTSGVGTLQVTGNATLGLNSTFVFDTNNTTDGILGVGGTVTLGGGTLQINDNFDTGGNRPVPLTTYTLISNTGGGAIAGTFHNLPDATIFTAGNDVWRISYFGGAGHDVTLTYLGRATTTAVASTNNPAPPNNATLQAAVTWNDPTMHSAISGNVSFFDNNVLLGSAALDFHSTATLPVTTLGIGPHSITATYSGVESAYPSTASPFALTVAKLVPAVAINAPGSVAAGTSTTLSANVASNAAGFTPTGQITFTYGNGIVLGGGPIDANGTASFTTSSLPSGGLQVVAHYSGDATFSAAASIAAPISVQSQLSAGNVELAHPAAGNAAATFTINLSSASNQPVTVNYGTVDGTARAGIDYTAVGGTLTFNPGETSKTVSVAVLGHGDWQPARAFTLALSSANNATINSAAIVGTIDSTNGSPAAGTAPDELNPTASDLVYDAPAGVVTIMVQPTKVAGQVQLLMNHKVVASAMNPARVIVYAGAGIDRIAASPKLGTGVIFFGGAGRDIFTGGGGNDILIGGTGFSTLNGGGGRNLLIAGAGQSRLGGSRFGDVLIGGATAYDAGQLSDILSLESLLNVWTDGQSHAARTAALALPVGPIGASLSSSTLSGLTTADKVTGVRNRDWLIVATPVSPHTRKSSKSLARAARGMQD
ncbi:MAG TPA: Ig-like domain repeat protein [Tepidisphaeraceae bacterium]|nr:Ig-like domain repeat protein [Tepidisphaeraceae bacterium]